LDGGWQKGNTNTSYLWDRILAQLDNNAPASWGDKHGPSSGEVIAHILAEYYQASQANTFGPCHQKGIEAQNEYRRKASGNDPLCAITIGGMKAYKVVGVVSAIGYSNNLVFVTAERPNGDLVFWEPVTKTEFVNKLGQAGIGGVREGEI
jgi:hypothetical protein